MSAGKGRTVTLPSGATLEVSPVYRYVLAVDANAGSWVEGRAKTAGPIRTRVGRFVSAGAWEFLRAVFVFDLETGERHPAAAWWREAGQ